MFRLLIVFVLAICCGLVPRTSRAEEENERLASEEFERGRRLYLAEDYLGCARHFEKAFRYAPSASVHYNIAKCYEMASVTDLAAQHYRAFLDARAGHPDRRSKVRESLEQLSGDLGWIRVSTQPDGATISADGRERGISPVMVALSKGAHSIEARLGEDTAAQRVIIGDSEQNLELELMRSEVTSETEETFVSTRERETESSFRTDPDEVEQTDEVEVGRSWQRLPRGLFGASVGLTVVSIGALAGCGVALLRTERYFLTLDESHPDFSSTQERGMTLEKLTTAFWITSGVTLVTTVLFAVFTNWRGSNRESGQRSSRRGWNLSLGQGAALELYF